MFRLALLLIAPGLLAAQVPRVGAIEVYGVRKVPEDSILKALGLAVGDRLPASKLDAEDRVSELPGVAGARLEAVCCTGDRAILYVGVQEEGGRSVTFRKPPNGPERLPEDTIEPYKEFIRAFEDAARKGNTAEDTSEGHPLAYAPNVRRIQERFRGIIPHRISILRRVLRESADPSHRAAAAAMIGYAPDKQQAENDLEDALRDPDEGVRANALRALAAMAGRRDVKIHVSAVADLLDSLVWSDKRRSAEALVAITSSRPAECANLRDSGPALREMAHWKTPEHAHAAFVLLGRISGMKEEAINTAWEKDKDSLLKLFPAR